MTKSNTAPAKELGANEKRHANKLNVVINKAIDIDTLNTIN